MVGLGRVRCGTEGSHVLQLHHLVSAVDFLTCSWRTITGVLGHDLGCQEMLKLLGTVIANAIRDSLPPSLTSSHPT
ncbi:hypothetical protein DPMN_046881 [Dreissena polymorpha]|uniref:Uncharacterized protein n=1 Tax=Dreissena polymorpha TaxID=45954 RepID=A0A9D4I0Z2_DREPO|nr:hypothetical protein DPMN_046881 [Dreissena polymorpha]